MNCKVCNKEVIEYTTKNNKTYLANPYDKSPHRIKSGGDVYCVLNWDEFQVVSKN